jgi:hypothetical protein
MAKKQTRRSISVSRTTYERLKAFCETNNISMSQLVETRVNDFLGGDVAPPPTAIAPQVVARVLPPRPPVPSQSPARTEARPPAQVSTGAGLGASAMTHSTATSSQPTPMTSAAARFAVDPPPPIIKPRQDTAAPKPAEKRPEQIFTF